MRKLGWAAAVLVTALALAGCGGSSGGGGGGGEGCGSCREDMRQFVQAVSDYARATQSGFIVVPQNGHNLLTLSGLAGGTVATAYVGAIDGVGREDLFFGYEADDTATPAADRDEMVGFMDLALAQGLVPLVTDYVAPGSANIPTSYASNAAKGYTSFAATHRDLDNIPAETTYASYYPVNSHPGAVATLGDALNFLYLLDPSPFADTATFLAQVDATNYDVLIIDAFDQDGIALTAGQIAGLQTKPGGAQRLVIAYMSIGEAEDYRYYWQSAWDTDPPSFLAGENPDWPGNFKVRYWDPAWQAIVTGNSGSYTQKLLDAGFDGVYLDIIDAFEYWEE